MVVGVLRIPGYDSIKRWNTQGRRENGPLRAYSRYHLGGFYKGTLISQEFCVIIGSTNRDLKGHVDVKKIRIVSICILIVTLVVMAVNKIVIPLSDWVIRMDGVIMLVSLFAVSFSTVKCIRDKS